MDNVSGFLNYFLAPLDPVNIGGALRALGELATSANLYFWLLIAVLARFAIPDLAVWLARLVRRPRAPALTGPGLPRDAAVSVVIAGRNVADGIAQTIRSALDCGYPNLEVIFVDDDSNDGSVACARTLENTGRVRVFEARRHNGKPSSLNVGLTMARGEFIFILDADSEIQHGAIPHLLAPFADPQVGAVAANLRVRNAPHNWTTRFQECEYALNVSVSRVWRAALGLLAILPGAGSMFRATAMRELGGYDSGLGDDTDLTLRMRKMGWKLRFALAANVWTSVPEKYFRLLNQRSRWMRNLVKVRLRKQGDMFRVRRFGFLNALVFADVLVFRVLTPLMAFFSLLYYSLADPFAEPHLLTALYWLTVVFLFFKLLIANDVAGTPRLKMVLLAPLYPFYRLPIHAVEVLSMIREFLRIRLWHPYVPKRIWARTPHW